MLIDSHCHFSMLDLAPFDGKIENLLKEAAKFQVKKFLTVSVDLETFPDVLRIAQSFENIWASVGVHPNTQDCMDPSEEELIELASDPKVIAIGETGLDYYRSEGDLTWQHDRFRRHIRAAIATQKPLIIHSRQAREDTLKILAEEKAEKIGGVMHCFAEDWDFAERAMDLNFYISFSGIVTFKNAKELQEIAKKMPSDRMLIETDSPYLAPVPLRGKPNYPHYVYYVAQFLAELREESFETISEQTTKNFESLFVIA